jgi:hypothetical protein
MRAMPLIVLLHEQMRARLLLTLVLRLWMRARPLTIWLRYQTRAMSLVVWSRERAYEREADVEPRFTPPIREREADEDDYG